MLYLDAVRTRPDAILLVGADRVVVDANPAALRLLGMGTVRGVPLCSLIEGPDCAAQFHIWARSPSPIPGTLVFKTGHGPQRVRLEAWCVQAAGSHDPPLVIVHGVAFDNAADRFLLLNDQLDLLRKEVFARRRVEAQLTEAVQARDEFIAIAAHELRNPLNVFHLSLQLLRRRAGEVAGVRELLDKSRFHLDRLHMLVERLLDVSRIRAGRFELHLEAFDLKELVAEAVARFREQFPDLQISAATDPGATGTWDRLRLDQAITNLLSNAIKYGDGKPVRIEVAVERGDAVISVTDEGIGLAPGDLERIFEQFERATRRANNDGSPTGFGLGLWIAQQVAKAHHGAVTAESELGKGSTFTLRLPLEPTRS